jgi:hypothetical protein
LAAGGLVFGTLSMGLRRSSSALRFGGMFVVGRIGLGSPVIWARRSEICVILSACFEVDIEEKESYRHGVRRGSIDE